MSCKLNRSTQKSLKTWAQQMILPPSLLSCTRAFPGRQIQLLYALAPLWDAFLLAASWTCCSISSFIYLYFVEAGWAGKGNTFLVAQGTDCKACASKHYRLCLTRSLPSGEWWLNETDPLHPAGPVHPSFSIEDWINLYCKEKEGGRGRRKFLIKWTLSTLLCIDKLTIPSPSTHR